MKKIIVLTSLIMMGCTNQNLSAPVAITKHTGWFYNDCLAIQAPNLIAGTNIILVDAEDTDNTHNSKVLGPATTSNECPALADDRRSVNAQDNKNFYLISKSKTVKEEGSFVFSIAVVISNNKTSASISETLDLNNDGIQDSFSSCASSEGINFDIWSADPYKSKNIWNGYYYLGYDIDPNCPV